MSYCRFSDDPAAPSDLYIYESGDAHAGYRPCWVCCQCPLQGGKDIVIGTRQALLDHLDVHDAAGHRYPASVRERLAEEEAEDG
jgi:hypothetical protein